MADPSQYFVLNSGAVHVVKPENIEEAKRRGLMPATEEQRRQYDLVQEAKKDPLGAVKAGAQALGEGVVGLAGLPAALIGVTPSIPEIREKVFPYISESIRGVTAEEIGQEAAIAKQKRMEMLRAVESVSPTLPRIQQELGLRTAEEIKAEAEAFPVARGIGTVASFFVGPAVSKLVKTAATKAVPVLAAEETLKATGALSDAVTKAVGLDAKNAAYQAAQAELAAATAAGDAVEIAAKRAAVGEAAAAAQAAVDDGFKLRTALLAEADAVPAELAPLVTKEVQAASKAAIKSAERMSLKESQRLLANVPKSQRAVADRIKSLQEATISSPAITSKIGTDAANAIERSALARLQKAPGFSTALAEADVAAARAADDIAVGAEKLVTAERLKQANESLATLKVRQELTAKAIGLGLGRSAEMMMFGLQGVANEMALGDPSLVAESAYATLGFDAGLGAGFGVAEALVPPTLRAGLRAVKATGNRLKDVLGKVYPEAASFITGAEPETIRAVLDAKEDLASKGLRRVIEEATPMPARLLEPEIPAGRLKPLKPVDHEAVAREFREALQEDVRQIAAPKEGGLLFDANNKWRKVQLNKTISDRVRQQTDEMVNAFYESKAGEPLTVADQAILARIEAGEFVNTPYREALNNVIGRVREARNVAKAYGMTGDLVPTAQEAAYKVSKALGGVEDRLLALEAGNPRPEQIFDELKGIEQELFYKKKGREISSRDLALVDRKVNAAYDNLRQDFKGTVLNQGLWGEAAVIDRRSREELRAYYAGLDNLEAAAPDGLIRLTKDPVTGLKTELIVDSQKLARVIKDINDPKYQTFRDALGQYFDGRKRAVNVIQEIADFVGANVDKAGVAKRMKTTEQAYDRAIQNAVNDASNAAIKSGNKALVKQLRKEYATANQARKAAIEKQVDALESGEKIGHMRAAIRVAAKIGGPSGVLFGGPLGAAVGSIVTAAADPVRVAKSLAKLNKAKIAVSDKVGGVANVLTGTGAVAVKTGEALGSFATRKRLDEEYKKVERRVRELAVDADALMDQQDAMLADMVDDAPTIADATKTVNATALQYLANVKPKPPANMPPMQLLTWEPVDADKRKFLRITDAVMNPVETLELAGKGALLPEQIDALNTVYPSLMADVRSKLLERIEQTGKVPEKHRMMVSMLLGKDIDGRMQAAKIVPAQSVYGQQRQVDAQKREQAQMPMTRAQRLNLAERADYEGSARRNAQLK